MYHYVDCGLPNVHLVNGYHEKDTPFGPAVAIDNLEGLHKAIGQRIVASSNPLTGPEVRFLRKELNMTQKDLAVLLGVNEQSVANWEKLGSIQPPEDRLLRALYAEHVSGNAKVRELVDLLAQQSKIRAALSRLEFEETEQGWVPRAA